MRRSFIVFGALLMMSFAEKASAQATLNATGGTYLATDLTEHDWSIGEVALVSTFYGPKDKNIVVTQGLLQNEISTPEKAVVFDLYQHLQVFPNPASSVVNVQYIAISNGTLNCKLMDMTGKLLQNQNSVVKSGINTEQLDISTLAAANYMLNITFKSEDGKETSVPFKIQKLN